MFEFRFYEIWRSPEYIETILSGCFNSFWLSLLGGVLGFGMGLGMALTQLPGGNRLFRAASIGYIEVVRNTPFIVQLFFVAFGLPLLLGLNWSFEVSALLAMTLNFSAYFAEVIRAGLEAVKKGQYEASQSLSLTPKQGIFHVVLPQALANVWPSLSSQFVFLFLTTGLISEIGVEDLTWAGRFVADRTFRDFEVFIVLTVLYMAIAFLFLGSFQLLKRIIFPWWGKRT
jgi:polar amino acid transport system permease protein